MTDRPWRFDVAPETAVVTTTYVTQGGMPVLHVLHEEDPHDGPTWQFHAGNGDYDAEVLQLVRLDEILELDPQLRELETLPVGCSATRRAVGEAWIVDAET